MRIEYAAQVQEDLRQIPPGPRALLRSALDVLRASPDDRPKELNIKRLAGPGRYYRIKVGEYRVVYARQGPIHRVVRIFHRTEGYGWLERLG